MTTIITLVFLMAISYTAASFTHHAAGSICARHRALLSPATELAIAPAVQSAGLYQHLSIRQLKKMAQGRVRHYSYLNKKELIQALSMPV